MDRQYPKAAPRRSQANGGTRWRLSEGGLTGASDRRCAC